MANTKFTGQCDIFEDAGGKEISLSRLPERTAGKKQYPLKATIQTLKGGKGLMAVFAAKRAVRCC